MTNEQLITALQKWPKDNEVKVMFGEDEDLTIVEVNEPGPKVDGPVIWIAPIST
jgi:hypothetical protein